MAVKPIYEGDTVIIEYSLFEADGTTPMDISGGSIKVAAQMVGSKVSPIVLTAGAGILVTDAPGGKVTATFPAGQIKPAGQWHFELQFVNATGVSMTLSLETRSVVKTLLSTE